MLVDDGLEILDETECRRLLATARIGRVAIAGEGYSIVVPVNFGVVDGDVVFFTGEGLKLAAAVAGHFASFEVDEIDNDREEGWSVLVSGRLQSVDDPDETARATEAGVRAWAGRRRTHLVRLHPDVVSGRRLRRDPDGTGSPT